MPGPMEIWGNLPQKYLEVPGVLKVAASRELGIQREYPNCPRLVSRGGCPAVAHGIAAGR
jgi:hypothetical protein